MCYVLSIFQIQQSLYAIKRVIFFLLYLLKRKDSKRVQPTLVANKRQLYLWAREGDTQQYFIFNGALKGKRKTPTHLVFTAKDLR